MILNVKVAIDVSAVYSGHSLRGIGTYTKNLISELKSDNKGLEIVFFEHPQKIPEADLIHYPYFDLFFHSLPIFKKTKRIVTIHDVIPLMYPEHFPVGFKGRINFFLQKIALKNVDFVICDSKISKDDISVKLSYPEEKIKTVYLAPGSNFKKIQDKSKLKKILKKLSLPENFILYVGDVNWNKNISNLLEAVKIMKINLVMVGSALRDEKLSQTREINQKIKDLGIEKQIFKTGYIEDDELVSTYNLSKLTVIPSFYEGFGLPVLESMACGVPVVCSKTSSLVEVGDDLPFYCNPHDPKDIADKIKIVLNLSASDKDGLSKKLISHSSKFTWPTVANQSIEIYKKVLG